MGWSQGCGLSLRWSVTKSPRWSFTKVVCHQDGLYTGVLLYLVLRITDCQHFLQFLLLFSGYFAKYYTLNVTLG